MPRRAALGVTRRLLRCAAVPVPSPPYRTARSWWWWWAWPGSRWTLKTGSSAGRCGAWRPTREPGGGGRVPSRRSSRAAEACSRLLCRGLLGCTLLRRRPARKAPLPHASAQPAVQRPPQRRRGAAAAPAEHRGHFVHLFDSSSCGARGLWCAQHGAVADGRGAGQSPRPVAAGPTTQPHTQQHAPLPCRHPPPGFHIGPLMASVGGVGVVLGLATQDLLQNIAAAVSLVRGVQRNCRRGGSGVGWGTGPSHPPCGPLLCAC